MHLARLKLKFKADKSSPWTNRQATQADSRINPTISLSQGIYSLADLVQDVSTKDDRQFISLVIILNCILNHASADPDEVKVFLSGNTNDFGKREVQEVLRDVGMNNYFSSTQALIDWQRSP